MAIFAAQKNGGSCWTCEHWGCDIIVGVHCTCLRFSPASKLIVSKMNEGCAFYRRAYGLDGMTDEEAEALGRRFIVSR